MKVKEVLCLNHMEDGAETLSYFRELRESAHIGNHTSFTGVIFKLRMNHFELSKDEYFISFKNILV